MTIISFRHNLIFIKTLKTAGTSIEIDLSRHVEPEAVVTPIFPEVAGHHPRNWRDAEGQALFRNHMPAREIRHRLGPAVFDGMRRVCVVRDPVEKCISHFHMLRNSPDHTPGYAHSWADYVAAGWFPFDLDWVSERRDGVLRPLVTDILRYDRLAMDLPALLAEQGIADFRLTARAKSEYSRNRLITPEEVTEAQLARIHAAFAEMTALCQDHWAV